MPTHWTYGEHQATDDLFQGDIISRTDEFVEMLRGVFPYFCDERYIGFLVTTQSCDLVRRGSNACKAKYISLAVIRELRPLLPQVLDEICGTGIPGVYRKESRFLAEQLLVRIINQNEQASGLFYLHPDADVGVATPSAVLLRITFSLRRQHYDLLVKARTGRLKAEYANKLGWLSGNLYSRVATPDWDDQEGDRGASKKQARQLLRFASKGNDENWVSEDWLKEAERKRIDLTGLTAENACSQLEQHAPPEPIEVMLQRTEEIGRELLAARELKTVLCDSADFLTAYTERLLAAVSGLRPKDRSELTEKLTADTAYCTAVCQSVSSEAKKQFKSAPATAVDTFLAELARKAGAMKPVLERVENVLCTTDQSGLSDWKAEVSSAKLFSSDVVEHVRAAVEPVVSEHAERHKELAARLRRDARVKTALRRLSPDREFDAE